MHILRHCYALSRLARSSNEPSTERVIVAICLQQAKLARYLSGTGQYGVGDERPELIAITTIVTARGDEQMAC